MATRAHACMANRTLEGKRGAPVHVAIEKTGCPAKLVLQGCGAVVQMLLSDLELVDIGEGRVLIVPDLQPSELTLDDMCVLTLEDTEEFWTMVHRARTATHRDIWGDKLHSPWAPSTPAPAYRRRMDSPKRLPAIPEVPRAEAACVSFTLANFQRCS
jgi:hypothetical protein